MKLAIVGSRTFNDYDVLEMFIQDTVGISNLTMIVSGGAKGADTLAEKFAKDYNIPIKIFRPNWKLGKSAGYLRNKDIVDECDILIAFWDGKSKGTKHSINLAQDSNKEYYVYFFD